MRIAFALLLCAIGAPLIAAERTDIIWPTPNTAWAEGKALGTYVQHAGSGDPESGCFGDVRSGGTQFHEGIDMKALKRDRSGEPIDDVSAAMSGIVRYVNSSAGDSSYGRYIVIEHPNESPAVYTLYAHLSRIGSGIRAGTSVQRGQVIATMGHSSGGYMIPKDRAHLHFEMGVMITKDFQSWYERKRFGGRNDHGAWNGMNLVGFDPLDFLNDWRTHKVNTVHDYFVQMKPLARIRIATAKIPDFIQRYSSLLTKPMPLALAGWEIKCDWTGLPFAWTPLSGTEVLGLQPNEPTVVEANAELEKQHRSKSVVVPRRGSWVIGKDLETILQQMFGIH